MSLQQCLEIAVKGREIDRAQADELAALYEQYRAQFALAYGPAQAQKMAKETLAKRLEAEATQRKRAALLQLEALQRLEKTIFSYRTPRGDIDPALALKRLISNHGETTSGMSSIAGREKAILGGAMHDLETMLFNHKRSFFSGRAINQARLENVRREILGQHTGDEAAKAFADAWMHTAERLRLRFNEMGGAIGKLEGGYIPQRHDGRKLRKAGFAAWSKAIGDGLDWDRMRHHLTGDPILPAERGEVLKWVYDTVTTEGWAHMDPAMTPKGRGALVRQHAESRFLHFKDAAAHKRYQDQFGEGDLMASMMGHLRVMARDIATMEILGPNPEATLNWLAQAVEKEGALAAAGMPARFATRTELFGKKIKDPASYARQQVHVARRMYDVVRGSAATPVNAPAAEVSQLARNIVTASSLGSAVLSAVTDPAFGAMARRFAAGPTGSMGLASDTFNTLSDTVRMASTMKRREAVRAGLIMDSMAHYMGEEARFAAGQVGIGRWLADRTLEWQGLNAWTQASRHGFGLFMQGQFADVIGFPWQAMDKQLRKTLQRYGIDEIDWTTMQRARLHDLSFGQSGAQTGAGSQILRPREIQELALESLPTLIGDQGRMVWRRLLDDLDQTARGNKRMSMLEITQRAEALGDAEFVRTFIDKFNIGDLSEVRALGQIMLDERRYEAGTLPTDAIEQKWLRYTRELGDRYAEMILMETDYAVPQATVEARAIMIGEGKPGTVTGELTQLFTQFKSFGIAVWMLHVHRLAREWATGNRAGAAGYAASLVLASTLLGAVAINLKSVRDGKDTQDLKSTEFWLRAMAQGGGWGIWGDFLLADTNRFGGGWAQTIAGPVLGRAENLWNLTGGNVRQLATDKNTNAGRELVKFADANLPFVNIWYAKLAWQRLVLDKLHGFLDPEAGAARRRRISYARKQGTAYWWRPGADAPDRAPDLGRAFGR